MDFGPYTVLKFLVPNTPLILKTAIFNTLSLSPNSAKQDARTEITVALLRSLLNQRMPWGKVQRGSIRDPGVKGPMWISKYTIPKPDNQDGPLDVLVWAIKELGDGRETYTLPEVADVEGEWTGYRSGVHRKAPLPDISEQEKYENMMGEVQSKLTILYFHGGAFMYGFLPRRADNC